MVQLIEPIECKAKRGHANPAGRQALYKSDQKDFFISNFYQKSKTASKTFQSFFSDDADEVVGEDDRVGLVVAGLVGAPANVGRDF